MGPKCDDDDLAFNDGEVNCVLCSICLDVVSDDGNRSWAKLLCGHKFHLDCIGSAFNAKGAMECPNCRKFEKGQWLFPNGSRSFPDYSMEDWARDEDLYELSYSELSVGARWPPFAELANIPAPFEERGYSAAAYHELLGQHTFAEHAAISAHPCPYIAYLGRFSPSSSYVSDRFEDNTNSSHWNGQSLPREVHEHIPFPAMDLHHHVWENAAHPPSLSNNRVGTAEVDPVASFTQRSSRTDSDLSSSSSRSGESISSSRMSPYPDSNMRSHNRVQALLAYSQQQTGQPLPEHAPLASSGNQQSSGQRSVSRSGMIASSYGLGGGFFFFSPVGSPDEHVEDRLTSIWSQADQDMCWEPSQSANLCAGIQGQTESLPETRLG